MLDDVVLSWSFNISSATTVSAAEIFTLMMRERPNTVLIGERSAGGFSDQLIKTLPHGLLYTISNEYYVSSLGEEFEGVGVPVNIEQVLFTLEKQKQASTWGCTVQLTG